MALITLKEYAERHGKNRWNCIQKALRGGYKTAHKIGYQWFIDEDEPDIDGRVKSGKYKGWRENAGKKSGETKEE